MQDAPQGRSAAPYVAAALALGYPVALIVGEWALAAVTAAAAVAGCALALARRPSVRLRLALGATIGWLAAAFAGALLLEGHALRGLAWVLVVLYAAPLAVIPWIYAKTFGGSLRREAGQR